MQLATTSILLAQIVHGDHKKIVYVLYFLTISFIEAGKFQIAKYLINRV